MGQRPPLAGDGMGGQTVVPVGGGPMRHARRGDFLDMLRV
jgi:hypothetical protein